MSVKNFKPEKCHYCDQSIEYLVPVDAGTVAILKSIAVKIGNKKQNIVHPRKEMETSNKTLTIPDLVREGMLTSNMVGNLSRPRMHGLIAKIDGAPGNYCLTTKGARFLRGEITISKYAIRDKRTGHTKGYFEEDTLIVHIDDFNNDKAGGLWEGIGYEIREGKVYEER